MSRTNIDLDDEAVADVMATYHLRSKRDAVNFALNKVRRRPPLTVDEALALRGTGFWDGDIEAIKDSHVDDFEVGPQTMEKIRQP
jgi:Arc/MetJ family transcription regulator